MRDNKRGTIEDPSTDRVLALAFEQEKQERLLRSAELDNALNDLSVTPNGVRLENFSVRVAEASIAAEKLAKEIPPLLGVDLTILRDDELMIAQAQAENEAAEDFIDGFLPRNGRITVVDLGRILVHTDDLDQVTKAADALGLSYKITAR